MTNVLTIKSSKIWQWGIILWQSNFKVYEKIKRKIYNNIWFFLETEKLRKKINKIKKSNMIDVGKKKKKNIFFLIFMSFFYQICLNHWHYLGL